MSKRDGRYLWADACGLVLGAVIFVVPFLFMFVNSVKDRREANLMRLSLPTVFHWDNYAEVLRTNDYQVLRAFRNSCVITIGGVVGIVIVCSMAGYIIQRRRDKISAILNFAIMIGLMIPSAILPTIWVMQRLHVYKTMLGLIMVEIALQIPFAIMLYRGYISTIPLELEEAGYIDGCNRVNLFTRIVFPLLQPVTSSVVILNAISIFNDFTNPLYFLPGSKNVTVQLTLYNFMGKYSGSYNMLFADAFIITVPMLVLFVFFNKKIVSGMSAGAVKG